MSILKYSTFSSIGPQKQDTSIPGTPPILKRGYVQYAWGQYDGKLHPIRFQDQIFIPEFPNPSGWTVWTPSWVTGTFYNYVQQEDSVSPNTVNGVVDWLTNNMKGQWAGGGYNVETNPFPEGSGISSLPAPSKTGGEIITPTAGIVNADEANGFAQKTSFWLAAIQQVSEIAQSTVALNMAEDEDELGPFTTGQAAGNAAGTMRWCEIYLPTAHNSSLYAYSSLPDSTGKPGIMMFGYYSWIYNGQMGELHYLNSNQTYAVPEMPGATDIYVNTVGGLQWQITYGYNDEILQSLYNTTGEVNLLAGEVAGLIP
jgi:hypothetical protein